MEASKSVTVTKPMDLGVVERIYRRAMQFSERHDVWTEGRCDYVMRMVRAKDRTMLATLERAVQVLDRAAEEQYGQTRRAASTDYSHRVEPTVVKAFKEAYRTMDEHRAVRGDDPMSGDGLKVLPVQFVYFYAAIAEFAEINIP